MNLYKSKNYENLARHFSRRIKVKCGGHVLAYLLLEKFAYANKPTNEQYIGANDAREKGIVGKDGYNTFKEFRDDMIHKGILRCLATNDEMKSHDPEYKANLFVYGLKIKRYIENEIKESKSILERIDTKADDSRVDKIECIVSKKADISTVNDLGFRVESLENEVSKLQNNVANLTDLILTIKPPNTHIRRNIVYKNVDSNRIELINTQLDEEEKSRLSQMN